MDHVERLDRVPRLYHTRDIDLARPLTDHFNVHITLRERLEHAPRHAHQVAHLLPDE